MLFHLLLSNSFGQKRKVLHPYDRLWVFLFEDSTHSDFKTDPKLKWLRIADSDMSRVIPGHRQWTV